MNFNLVDGLVTSALGLAVVFVVLIALALVTLAVGKLVQDSEAKKAAAPAAPTPAPAAAPAAPAEAGLEEELAILHCVLSQETGIPADQLVITSVTVKD